MCWIRMQYLQQWAEAGKRSGSAHEWPETHLGSKRGVGAQRMEWGPGNLRIAASRRRRASIEHNLVVGESHDEEARKRR